MDNPGPIGPYRDSLGKFEKGNPGRPKGVGHKATQRVKEAIANFVDNNIDKIQEDFDKLKPLARLQFITALLPYVVPKLSNIEGEINQNHSGGITITWTEPQLPDSENKGSPGIVQSLPTGIPDNNEPGGGEVGQDV